MGVPRAGLRGEFDRPEAAGSELAIRDVVDAIDHVDGLADIDLDRVFVTGLSGGGMMTLLMAGHHPDRFAGAAAFVPVHALHAHYEHTARELPDQDYAQIEAICGGDPAEEPDAREDCLARSPATYLDDIRDAGAPIYLGHGLQDDAVPPDAALRIFDGLADEDDRFGEQAIEATDTGRLPDELDGRVDAETHFGDGIRRWSSPRSPVRSRS